MLVLNENSFYCDLPGIDFPKFATTYAELEAFDRSTAAMIGSFIRPVGSRDVELAPLESVERRAAFTQSNPVSCIVVQILPGFVVRDYRKAVTIKEGGKL